MKNSRKFPQISSSTCHYFRYLPNVNSVWANCDSPSINQVCLLSCLLYAQMTRDNHIIIHYTCMSCVQQIQSPMQKKIAMTTLFFCFHFFLVDSNNCKITLCRWNFAIRLKTSTAIYLHTEERYFNFAMPRGFKMRKKDKICICIMSGKKL